MKNRNIGCIEIFSTLTLADWAAKKNRNIGCIEMFSIDEVKTQYNSEEP